MDPQLATFRERTVDDPVRSLAKLRAALEAAGGPLIHPLSEDTVLVTLIWIGPEAPVSVQSPLFVSRTPMERIPDTDVWHLSTAVRADITTTYHFCTRDPHLLHESVETQSSRDRLRLAIEAARRTYPDPFNPRRVPGLDESSPESSILELPRTEDMPWFGLNGSPSGRIEALSLSSHTLGNERAIHVYLPAGYQANGRRYPVVVMLDGQWWFRSGASDHVLLDNLIAAKRIPPIVVAFVHNAESALPLGMDRALEMTCNPDLVSALSDELLPLLQRRYWIDSQPASTVIAGWSFGGLAAAYIGFERSDLFGNALASSPAMWWGYADDDTRFRLDEDSHAIWLAGNAEPEWLTRQYASGALRPLRLWVDVGCIEVNPLFPMLANGLDYRTAVRHFRDVLLAKNYEFDYYEAPGGHDWVTFRRNVVRGLQALLGPSRVTSMSSSSAT
jgi:enterochelin esterase family protein